MSLINISLDLTKIDKSRIREGKNGQKYISLVVASNQQPDQYGNTHSVYHSQTEDERKSQAKRIFCGNGKEYTFNKQQPPQQQYNQAPPQQKYQQQYQAPQTNNDDLPF